MSAKKEPHEYLMPKMENNRERRRIEKRRRRRI